MRSHMPVERTVYFYSSLSTYSLELLVNYPLSSMNCQSFPIGVAWPPLWQRLSPSPKSQGVAEVKHGDSLLSIGFIEVLSARLCASHHVICFRKIPILRQPHHFGLLTGMVER